MTKTLPKSNFRTQLRGMLQLHSETITAPLVPAPVAVTKVSRERRFSASQPDVSTQPTDASLVTIANLTGEVPEQARQPVTPIPTQAVDINPPRVTAPQASQPIVPMPPIVPLLPQALNRFSVRIENSELESLNRIIVGGIQGMGERITASDIFRIGLSRVGKGIPISPEEITALRKTDRRRFKPNHANKEVVGS